MAKPPGKCAFCGGTRLTKGHIWPESFSEILPSNAKYHEQRIGVFETFKPTVPTPSKWERVGTGPLQKRRPRNTCVKCNTGWMSRIEANSFPTIRPLILGEPCLVDIISQFALAAILALVAARIELIARGPKPIPKSEFDHLRTKLHPSANWRIWIAQHAGADLKDYLFRYTAMQIESQPTTHFGPEYCNTQVTTLIAGQLYAHVFFSTVWPDFPGYSLIQIWPPTYPYIDTGLLPAMSDRDGVMLHETISRLGKRAV